MGLIGEYEAGQTPLDPEEIQGLLLPGIITKKELDEAENDNIDEALLGLLLTTIPPSEVIGEEFMRR